MDLGMVLDCSGGRKSVNCQFQCSVFPQFSNESRIKGLSKLFIREQVVAAAVNKEDDDRCVLCIH